MPQQGPKKILPPFTICFIIPSSPHLMSSYHARHHLSGRDGEGSGSLESIISLGYEASPSVYPKLLDSLSTWCYVSSQVLISPSCSQWNSYLFKNSLAHFKFLGSLLSCSYSQRAIYIYSLYIEYLHTSYPQNPQLTARYMLNKGNETCTCANKIY